jgi:hypothetical protein
LDLWESCEKKKAIDNNKQFFTSVLERFNAVSIYSLNYDPLLYEATKQIKVKSFKNLGETELEDDKTFETGFSNSDGFNYKKFYYRNNVIAFLHGHIGFVSGGTDNMLFYDNYIDAQQKRISDVAGGLGGYYRKGPKGIHYNVSLTSGLEKLDSFYDNPYACYIQRFSKDLMESEYIVFIGSGLGDMHVNLFATTAWRVVNGYIKDIESLSDLWRWPDERRKIIIVTQHKAVADVKELLMTDIGRGLFDLFKEGISWDGEADSSLKSNGYANINRDLFLYLNGTEKFFSEIWKIKDLFD